MNTLNLGILAHVDAGKTSLTERLLYAAGVIDQIGSVDAGSTQTDSLALERQRGITIKSAVVSFVIDDLTVNLIDTPGHPDFIAEVERVLGVLDGAVLVVSAVEGVQAQTRILMRTLRRMRIPTLVFVNKIDRRGADSARVLRAVTTKLTSAVIPMGVAHDEGARSARFAPFGTTDPAFSRELADVLAEYDDALLAAYIDAGSALPYCHLRSALVAQTRRSDVHPVFLGSAITGAGIDSLMKGIHELLPPGRDTADVPASGTVFKIERGSAGEKIAYARVFSGAIHTRDRLDVGLRSKGTVTAISVFDRGSAVRRSSVSAGHIAKLWGLGDVQVGDVIGAPNACGVSDKHFAPPTLETVVVPARPADKAAVHAALAQLAEQDPLINLRQDDVRQEISVSLYGEVQKEVIQATLANDYGLAVTFRETTPICVERPASSGAAFELITDKANPFFATVGLRVDPGPVDSGVQYGLDVELGSLPLAFHKAVEESVRETLGQGLRGWQVVDCVVSMTHSGFYSPLSTASDFRGLTPLVLMDALRRASTVTLQPMHRFRLDIPADSYGQVLPVVGRHGGLLCATVTRGHSYVLEGEIPAGRVHQFHQQLPGLTHGEGVLESTFDRYDQVHAAIPSRPRTDHNPLDRKEYLLHVLRRV